MRSWRRARGAIVAAGIGRERRIGDPITLNIPHCDPTVNLYDSYHVVSGDTLVASGRHRKGPIRE